MEERADTTSGAPPEKAPEGLPAPDRSLRLSEEIAVVETLAGRGDVKIEEILKVLERRGYAIMAILFSLPFIQPLPTMGLSTPFGIAITVTGFQMALARKPWLPKRVTERAVSESLMKTICSVARKVLRVTEKVVKPRGRFLHAHPGMIRVNGACICLMGAMMGLPLPIPMSNAFPAMAVLLLSLGSLEEDGLFIVLGYLAMAATFAFYALLPYLVTQLPGLFG